MSEATPRLHQADLDTEPRLQRLVRLLAIGASRPDPWSDTDDVCDEAGDTTDEATTK